MLISSAMGSVEYAIGLLRSAQTRVIAAGTDMSAGRFSADNPAVQRELKLAKAEQKLALRILESQHMLDDTTLDMIA